MPISKNRAGRIGKYVCIHVYADFTSTCHNYVGHNHTSVFMSVRILVCMHMYMLVKLSAPTSLPHMDGVYAWHICLEDVPTNRRRQVRERPPHRRGTMLSSMRAKPKRPGLLLQCRTTVPNHPSTCLSTRLGTNLDTCLDTCLHTGLETFLCSTHAAACNCSLQSMLACLLRRAFRYVVGHKKKEVVGHVCNHVFRPVPGHLVGHESRYRHMWAYVWICRQEVL